LQYSNVVMLVDDFKWLLGKFLGVGFEDRILASDIHILWKGYGCGIQEHGPAMIQFRRSLRERGCVDVAHMSVKFSEPADLEAFHIALLPLVKSTMGRVSPDMMYSWAPEPVSEPAPELELEPSSGPRDTDV
jgi:hypothetical protein